MKITREFIEANKSSKGGWNNSQLACLGIDWPPQRGWIAVALAIDHSEQALREFVKFGEKRPSKAERKAIKALHAASRKKQRSVYHPRVPSSKVAGDEFLQSYEWRRLRMQALKLYGSRCQCCGATPADGATMNVDHIKPRRIYPDLALSLDNLQVLCHECNHGKGNWDMTDWRPPSEFSETLVAWATAKK